jgi:hypothetical protein
MSNYKLVKVKNNVGIFRDEHTRNVVYVPQRNWSQMQKYAMSQFLNPTKDIKFKHTGIC